MAHLLGQRHRAQPRCLRPPARASPGVSESAGRKKGNAGIRNSNRYLARVLGEAAVSAGCTHTFLDERYRRIARRRGRKPAIVAVGRSIMVIIWALLFDEEAQFIDLGPDYYASLTNPERKVRQRVRELQTLGYTVTLNPAARPPPTGSSRTFRLHPGGCRMHVQQEFSDQATSDKPWSRYPVLHDALMVNCRRLLRGREQRLGLRGPQPLIDRELILVQLVDRRRGIEGAGRLHRW